MSAAVLCAPFHDPSNFMTDHSYWQVHNWMLAMANYPPPPPPDQTHYNAIYPTSAGAQQMMEPAQQEPMQYGQLNPAYAKVESGSPDQSAASSQIHHLAQELNQHAALEDQQRHQIQQAAQQIQHAANQAHHPPGMGPQLTTQQQATSNEKSNRLRKACDSCSIRKVKVCIPCVWQGAL
jgi:hypothetical protein